MKIQIILIILGLALSISENERRKRLVERINKRNTTWKAEYYGDDFKVHLGYDFSLIPKNAKVKKFDNTVNDFPKAYDLRKVYPKCETLFEIRDQSVCGGCWAFAAVEVMSDRLCIKSKGAIQTRVSAQNVITCCEYCGFGCHGGNPFFAYQYWEDKGVYYYI